MCSFIPDFFIVLLANLRYSEYQDAAANSPYSLLRADLEPKGFVGGKGSPPRSVHEAIQVSPHFFRFSNLAIMLSRCASSRDKRRKLVRNKPSPVFVALTTKT